MKLLNIVIYAAILIISLYVHHYNNNYNICILSLQVIIESDIDEEDEDDYEDNEGYDSSDV